MHRALTSVLLTVLAGSARAAEMSSTASGPGVVNPREAFLAAAIGAMVACGLTSSFLSGRVSGRTHAALSLLVVLIGAFSLFTLFGLLGRGYPAAGTVVVLALIGLFKLMNQFEIHHKPGHAGK